MRTETVTRSLYQFSELCDEAKANAREWYRQATAEDSFWSECAIEDLKENTLPLLGIEAKAVYFSGFWSQGDGAQFVGEYSYPGAGSLAKLRNERPAIWKDKATGEARECPWNRELIELAEKLASIQRRHFYRLSASVEHAGHYYHELCTSIEVRCDCARCNTGDYCGEPSDADAEELQDALRDVMRYCYRYLESEWEFQNSDEAVTEAIEANQYEFDADGNIA